MRRLTCLVLWPFRVAARRDVIAFAELIKVGAVA